MRQNRRCKSLSRYTFRRFMAVCRGGKIQILEFAGKKRAITFFASKTAKEITPLEINQALRNNMKRQTWWKTIDSRLNFIPLLAPFFLRMWHKLKLWCDKKKATKHSFAYLRHSSTRGQAVAKMRNVPKNIFGKTSRTFVHSLIFGTCFLKRRKVWGESLLNTTSNLRKIHTTCYII